MAIVAIDDRLADGTVFGTVDHTELSLA